MISLLVIAFCWSIFSEVEVSVEGTAITENGDSIINIDAAVSGEIVHSQIVDAKRVEVGNLEA